MSIDVLSIALKVGQALGVLAFFGVRYETVAQWVGRVCR